MFKDSNKVRSRYNNSSLIYRQVRHYSSNSSSLALFSMPFFSREKKIRKKENNEHSFFLEKITGSYLAGLIEGDGHIAIHDRPLAEKLSTELKVGKVIDRSSAGHLLLQILAKEEVLKIINLINGHMRTPKIEALDRAIS
jgi:hypothetical protein